ncbi:penicillin-binding protein activator LpoB [Endozoicomonas gorgoniicola]|uniref:Penicillin-binding protein activator LpoB n=1 Tax=Endozoicomonas gorgoniicola TaxID=1234144 RepID=A0ABT3MPY2_9GAMM|nr:penicillin-binding protein activator LpoB [Endozoicomonas gorgoniicola]MCW7551417.1 penicillin-binding protein activator LpoB [Endozoicomonas gorgoniicola]
MKIKVMAGAILASVMLTGCATKTYYVDQNTGQTTKQETVAGLNYRDFSDAADEMVQSMLNNPRLRHPNADKGAVYVMAISSIINDTTQRIDTDQLTKKIRVDLLNSGRFLTTTAIGLNGAEDEMTEKVRALKNSKLVNQQTVKGNNKVIAPDFSLSGKIIQRNFTLSKSEQEINYYLQMTLTNLENGLAYWEGEVPIVKKGDGRSVSW